jgi:hypothetical protein
MKELVRGFEIQIPSLNELKFMGENQYKENKGREQI